jgi:hypothetical protein
LTVNFLVSRVWRFAGSSAIRQVERFKSLQVS